MSGFGNQKGYAKEFASAMRYLYDSFSACGAEVVGDGWDSGNYRFKASKALIGDTFVGLGLSEENQRELTEQRLEIWLQQIQGAWA